MTSEVEALIEFAAASSLLTIVPGLDTALIIRTAAVEGRRSALVAGLGICLGVLFWGLIASTGLGALFAASRWVYDAVRIAGALYLMFLGFNLLIKAQPAQEARSAVSRLPGRTRASSFRRGLLTNLLNPKVGLFYVSFLPQFVPATAPVAAFSMLLACVHAAESFLWFLFLTRAVGLLARWLARRGVQAAISRMTGAVFVALGVKLVLARR